jgi:Ala-tRNA(Pro) deacylase
MTAALEQQLAAWDIAYQKVEHPAVFTYAEAEAKVPPMPGAHTKNLFLRDRKGRRHVLVVVSGDKRVDLGALARQLAVDKLSLASRDRLWKYLGVEPGAVTLLALINDCERVVEVVIDRSVWAASALQCHPLVNTATLVIERADVERFLEKTGQVWRVVDVPARAEDV